MADPILADADPPPKPDPSLEQVSARTLTGKLFDLGNGQKRLITSGAIAHIPEDVARFTQGDTTAWSEAHPLMVLNPDGTYGATGTFYELRVRPDAVAYTLTSKIQGALTIRLVALNGAPVPPAPPPSLNGNVLTFENLVPGFSVDLRCQPGRVSLEKRIADASAPHQMTWEALTDGGEGVRLNWQTEGHDNATLVDQSRPTLRQRYDLEITVDVADPMPQDGGGVLTTAVETVTGRVIQPNVVTRVKALSDDIRYPLWVDVDVVVSITTDSDDGSELLSYGTPGAWTNRQNATYGNKFFYYLIAQNGRFLGWRFRNVTVPQGATISVATLKLHISYASSGSTITGYLWGAAADNLGTWGTGAGPLEMTKTSAKTVVSMPSATTGNKNVTVTSQVQEIVNRGGWVSGNVMGFALLQGTSSDASADRSFDDYSATFHTVAELDITYTAGGVTVVPLLTLLGVG